MSNGKPPVAPDDGRLRQIVAQARGGSAGLGAERLRIGFPQTGGQGVTVGHPSPVQVIRPWIVGSSGAPGTASGAVPAT